MLENVLNSIINPSDATIYDEGKPYSFLQFVKFYNGNINTSEIISEYNTYIQKWCETKYNQYDINVYKEIIQQQYIALLKEIELDYTSTEEKRFLNALSFDEQTLNDPAQLNSLMDIIIPFYIEKIKSICKYYIDKREEYKFNVQDDKIICSPEAISRYVKNVILDELATNISNYNSIPLSSLDTLPQILSVDVTNLYDQTDYFDRNETYNVNNTNEIPYKGYYDFDGAVIDAIRQYPFYLIDSNIYCFSVNPGLTSNDVGYLPIKEFIYNYKSPTSNKNDLVLNLQKRLVEKYSGSDYYYIQTDENNEPMSGVLIEAENDILNILNVDIVNTPTIADGDYNDVRRLGLNFTPDKFGLLFYNTNNLSYSIDTTKLVPNSIYIFPDPNRFNRYDVPLVWFIDSEKIKLNKSSQFAHGRPKSDPLYQYFYSYFSTNQKQDSQNTRSITFKKSFESLIDKGIIAQYKNDSFGNEYALFKADDYYKNPKSSKEDQYVIDGIVIDENTYINQILNGNLQPDYFTALPLTSSDTSIYYYLKMGDLSNNNFYLSSIYDINSILVDGGEISSVGLTSFNTSADNWPNLSGISYSTLLDAGISGYLSSTNTGDYPVVIPVNSLNLTGADITLDGYNFTYDGGYWKTEGFIEKSIYNEDHNHGTITQPVSTIYDEIPLSSETITLSDKLAMSGEFMFKNIYTDEILPAVSALSAIYNKFNIEDSTKPIYNELSSNDITDIDIINNVIFITTKNYIVYDKIEWDSDNNQIIKSVYNPHYIDLRKDTGNTHYFDKPSTYFYLEKDNRVAYVQFTKMDGFDNVYYPVLNLINLDDLSIIQLKFNDTYPLWTAQQFDWGKLINDYGVQYISQPKLIYNSLNNLYNLSIFCYDSSGLPSYYNISFIYDAADIILYSNRYYKTEGSITIEAGTMTLGEE